MNRRAFWLRTSEAITMVQREQETNVVQRHATDPVDGTYAQSLLATGTSRWLFISGQVPEAPDGSVPIGFREQCRMAWGNVRRQLATADMTVEHLVKVTVFLADRRYRDEARQVRQEVLGRLVRPPALTVVIVEIYDSAWLIEIEAIAAA